MAVHRTCEYIIEIYLREAAAETVCLISAERGERGIAVLVFRNLGAERMSFLVLNVSAGLCVSYYVYVHFIVSFRFF